MARTFEDKPAAREAIPLLIGLTGASGSGKTYSALRLAKGIQRVVGGDIFVGDSEARRSLHYAEKFKFRHVPFGAPFSPMDYLALVEYCAGKGAKTIVIDSTSHLHEGPGGVLEMHAEEVERSGKGESANFRAWAKPKAELRRFINAITQMPMNFIFCFRAKEKVKPNKQTKDLDHLGWMPIASDEFIYEMTTNILLYPGSGGIPTWQTKEIGEQSIIKLPEQFRQLFGMGAVLDEDTGQKMAEWAGGGVAPKPNYGPNFSKNRDDWMSFWDKKGIGAERVLSALGRTVVDDMTPADLATMTEQAAKLKAKKATLTELFPRETPPPDDEDEEQGDVPSAEEMSGEGS